MCPVNSLQQAGAVAVQRAACEAGLSIEELARDIERRGLLLSQNVRPVLNGKGQKPAPMTCQPADATSARSNVTGRLRPPYD
jgi:hypothetical protein